MDYINFKIMKTKNKDLFIIFGTTRGIGKAFLKHAEKNNKNDFILINRKIINIAGKNNHKKVVIDLSQLLTKTKISRLCGIFLKQKKYNSINLILNASTIDPIEAIGFVKDELLLESAYVNFLNYERIINIFISETQNSDFKKKILIISSGSAESPNAGLSSYSSAKAALEMFVKCVFLEQKELRQAKILALRPGIVNTNMQKKIRSASKDDFPDSGRYKDLFKKNKLLNPEAVGEKMYHLLKTDKYWQNPVINISDIKL